MSPTPNPSFPTEILLADGIIRHIPRVEKMSHDDLKRAILWEFPGTRQDFNKHYPVALEILLEDKLLKLDPVENDITKYSLTSPGRDLQQYTDGYLIFYKEKKEALTKRGTKADTSNKIFSNKVKIIVFSVGMVAAVAGILGKCISDTRKAQADQPNPIAGDSISQPSLSRSNTDPSLSAKKHHPRDPITQPSNASKSETGDSQPERSAETTPVKTTPKVMGPLQVPTSDNIQFKLMKAVGSIRAQTIMMTITLTTDKANWYIMSYVKSIIDPDGNEYKVKSFTNGASTWDTRIDLVTGIPIKCSYTFGGDLSDVKTVKLF